MQGVGVASYVDPFIGTSNFGATYPGPVVPWGMVSVVPFNVTPDPGNSYSNTNSWCSNPYVHNNSVMTGFSHVNLSGVGCPDFGSIILMPQTGELEVDFKKYGSTYSNEEARPGYYAMHLDRYNIKAEMSATRRSGISRYTFPEGESHILLDLGHGLTNESGASVMIVSDTEIEGFKLLGTFCYNPQAVMPVYFVVRFSKPALKRGYWKKQPELPGIRGEWSPTSGRHKIYKNYSRAMAGDETGTWFSFQTQKDEQIEVQVGISFVSTENARLNLETEQQAFDLDNTARKAYVLWDQELSKIMVEGGGHEDKVKFYTALYHTLIHPNTLNDVNGMYPGMESASNPVSSGHDRYTVFSLWDTYRTVHPLLSLVYPQQQLHMVRSMLDMYRESGWLPKWELYSKETHVMEGDPALIVLADTYRRGITGFDVETAWEAMTKHALTPQKENFIRPDNDFFRAQAYVPFTDSFDNSVSQALEYYVADYALSQLAGALGHKKEAREFYEHSLGYRQYFDAGYGLLRPKKADGTFLEPFNPLQGENFAPVHGFHEGNAWQYSFSVPHDIKGLMRLHGGPRPFVEKLQQTFTDSLFDMGNEPDMIYPWLFNYVKGQEWRTQQTVHDCINRYFDTTPGGLPGNDDTGTMSAWLVYGMMGFYPVSPGDPVYALSSPVFDKVTIHLDQAFYSGKTITIKTVREQGPEDTFIRKMELNGKEWKSYFIDHDQLVNDAHITYYLNSR